MVILGDMKKEMDKVLVFGANGCLGSECVDVFSDRNEVISCTRKDADLASKKSVIRVLNYNKPDIVINCSANTDLKDCETNKESVIVNGESPYWMAEWCMKNGAKFIHISTSYVFDGKLDDELSYTEDDEVNPVQAYGEAKLLAEELISKLPFNDWCIIRTDWLYGKNSNRTFERLLNKIVKREPIGAVSSEKLGSPTYAKRLAQQIEKIIDNNVEGIVHAVGEGAVSKHFQLEYCIHLLGLEDEVEIKEAKDSDFDIGYVLPHNSTLENKRLTELGVNIMGSWAEQMMEFIENEIAPTLESVEKEKDESNSNRWKRVYRI